MTLSGIGENSKISMFLTKNISCQRKRGEPVDKCLERTLQFTTNSAETFDKLLRDTWKLKSFDPPWEDTFTLAKKKNQTFSNKTYFREICQENVPSETSEKKKKVIKMLEIFNQAIVQRKIVENLNRIIPFGMKIFPITKPLYLFFFLSL